MAERMKKYLKRTEELLEYLTRLSESGEPMKERVEKEKAELLVQIGFFQHERLIHLIVTALFAIMTILVFLLAVTRFELWVGVLLALLLVLLIPYIRHYWLLENGTQKLYYYYDKLEGLYNGKN